MSRLARVCALAATALVPSLLLASPAQAASYTVSFTPNGFSSALGSAQTGEAVTVTNATLSDVTVTFVSASVPQTRTIRPSFSTTFVMPADVGAITAQAVVAQPVHVIS